eukprot:scaffold10070_cov103-Phaeocystis_antarctica.AAC.1
MRPPTPLGHRVFGCTKYHDLGLHLRVSVPQQRAQSLLCGHTRHYRGPGPSGRDSAVAVGNFSGPGSTALKLRDTGRWSRPM